jgi:hypothetical protein
MTSNYHSPPSINHQSNNNTHITYYLTGTSQVQPATEGLGVVQAFENIFLGGGAGADSSDSSSDSSVSDLGGDTSSSDDDDDAKARSSRAAAGVKKGVVALPGPKDAAAGSSGGGEKKGPPQKKKVPSSGPRARTQVPQPSARSPGKQQQQQQQKKMKQPSGTVPKASAAASTSAKAAAAGGSQNRSEGGFGKHSRPAVDVAIISAEEHEAAEGEFRSTQTLETRWMVTGLGRDGDLSETSSVNFDEISTGFDDALAVSMGADYSDFGLGPTDDMSLPATAAGGEGEDTTESLLARYLAEAGSALDVPASDEDTSDVELTRRSASDAATTGTGPSALQMAILGQYQHEQQPQQQQQHCAAPLSISKQMQTTVRRDSGLQLSLSLSDDDDSGSGAADAESYNSEVDASWDDELMNGNGANGGGSSNNHNQPGSPNTSNASTASARHDDDDDGYDDGVDSGVLPSWGVGGEDGNDEEEEEEDDLNVSQDQDGVEATDAAAPVATLRGEWERLARLGSQQQVPQSFASEWSAQLQENEEEGGQGLSVNVNGGNARGSISFESLFIEEDDDEDEEDEEDGTTDTPVAASASPDSLAHSSASTSPSMNLSDFVRKYVFCYTIVLSSFLVCDVSTSLLSI